ncbi:hypothetical protein BDL97_01G142600 [Sphagnum fallax]|nr:hypothetical protein BDL97_01G142600 [Sphagnum fallax]
MEDEKGKEEAAPLEFSAFPFKPYDIQTRFMTAVYRALQQGGVAIVESPTGTGKTLSLICSALKWLEDEHALRLLGRPKAELQSSSLSNGVDEDPDWMRDFEVNKEEQRRREKEERKQQLKKLQKSNLSMSRVSTARSFFGDAEEDDAYFNRKRQNGQVKKKSVTISSADEDDEFLIEDYCSDDNAPRNGALKRKTNKDVSSSSDEDVEEDDDDEEVEPLKVFFCSRTHSQLSQFVGELQRTAFNSSLQSVTIGSRKTLCINPEVMKLGSSARINERCLELHKSKSNEQTGTKFVKEAGKQRKKSKSAGCPMLQKKKLQRQFKDELAKSGALDIEDLLKLGHRLGTCPYYGARRAVPAADLVVLPYQSLLHSATRESLGVNLKDCVIIIDEAHNLVDTVTSIHSCQVTASQLQQVSSQLSEYLEKFKARLAEGNCHYIQTLLQLIKAFLDRLSAPKATSSAPSHRGISNGADIGAKKADIMNINDFSFSLGIESINLFKLRRYIKESNIVHKVSSYGEKIALEQIIPLQQRNGLAIGSMLQSSSSMTGFHALADVILALTNADADGRILVVPNSGKNCEPTDGYIKFVMLNAAKHFVEVVKEARAVVLAGGTLQPISQLYDCLFPHLPPEKVHTFSCGHIVPPDSILPIALARGPGGHTFNFTYQSRGTPIMRVLLSSSHLLSMKAKCIQPGKGKAFWQQLKPRSMCSGNHATPLQLRRHCRNTKRASPRHLTKLTRQ